jgi:hypothetical protein
MPKLEASPSEIRGADPQLERKIMNAKRALCAILAVLASACAGVPTWDTNAFPPQAVYDAPGAQPPAIATAAATK